MANGVYKIRVKLGDVEIEVEGDKEFVESHLAELKKEMPKMTKELPQEKKAVISEVQKEAAESKKLSLSEFYKQKQPKDHNETAVVFAYWLEKKEKKEEFKPKDISACYDQARIPKPKNVQQHVVGMASGKKAYLTAGNKSGRYKLTLSGEEFVEKELPRKTEK